MVGEGILLECLNHPDVEQVLVINRKSAGVSHPKLREIVHTDFFNLAPVEQQLTGFQRLLFLPGCIVHWHEQGGLYAHYLRPHIERSAAIAKLNPEMTFCYVTGAGTDSSEQGRIAWARVKGATENALIQLFKQAYMFRPALMKATPGQKNLKSYYKLFAWLYPIGRYFTLRAFVLCRKWGGL